MAIFQNADDRKEKSKQDDNTRMKMIVNKCDCHYRRKKVYIFLLLQLNKFISGYVSVCMCVCVAQIRLQQNHFLWMSSPISPSES